LVAGHGGKFYLNTEPLESVDLEKRLRAIFEPRPGVILLFYADPGVPFGVAAEVMNRASKIVPIAIVTISVIANEPSCWPRP